LEKKTKHPIGLVPARKGKFLGGFHPSHVSEVMWLGDVQTCGCSDSQGCIMLFVGAFVEGELYLSWMHFSKSVLAFILFLLYFSVCFFFFFFFLFKG
jgi:hypothetical protein